MKGEVPQIGIDHPGNINHPGEPTNNNLVTGALHVSKALTEAVSEEKVTPEQASVTAQGYLRESL